MKTLINFFSELKKLADAFGILYALRCVVEYDIVDPIWYSYRLSKILGVPMFVFPLELPAGNPVWETLYEEDSYEPEKWVIGRISGHLASLDISYPPSLMADRILASNAI